MKHSYAPYTIAYVDVTSRSFRYNVKIARPDGWNQEQADEYDMAYELGIKRIEEALDDGGYEVYEQETYFGWYLNEEAEWHVELQNEMRPIDLECSVASIMLRALEDFGLRQESEL